MEHLLLYDLHTVCVCVFDVVDAGHGLEEVYYMPQTPEVFWMFDLLVLVSDEPSGNGSSL